MSLQQNIRCLADDSSKLRCQRGAISIEYALLSALIAISILVSVGNTGSALSSLWADIELQVRLAIAATL